MRAPIIQSLHSIFVICVFIFSFKTYLFSQNFTPFFGSDAIKYQLLNQLIEHGSFHQMVKTYESQDGKFVNFQLDSTLTLIIQNNSSSAEVRSNDSILLKVEKTKNNLIVLDQFDTFERTIFYTKRNEKIKKVIVYSILSNKTISELYFKKNTKRHLNEGKFYTDELQVEERKRYEGKFMFYKL